jgi:hypothetical protein
MPLVSDSLGDIWKPRWVQFGLIGSTGNGSPVVAEMTGNTAQEQGWGSFAFWINSHYNQGFERLKT